MLKNDGVVAAPNGVVVEDNKVVNVVPLLLPEIFHTVIFLPEIALAFNATFHILTGSGH